MEGRRLSAPFLFVGPPVRRIPQRHKGLERVGWLPRIDPLWPSG